MICSRVMDKENKFWNWPEGYTINSTGSQNLPSREIIGSFTLNVPFPGHTNLYTCCIHTLDQGIIYLNIIIYLFTLEILNNNIWNHWLNFVLFILSNNSKMANEYKNQFNSLLSYSFSLFVKNRWFIHRNLTIFRYSWNPLCFINKTTSSS